MPTKKEIVALHDHEHVLYRPTMYIGSIEPTEDKVPIIHNNQLIFKNMVISTGFYKLMNEILDNAFDEAKRLQGKPCTINVYFNSKTGLVTIKDTGSGFYKGTDINEKTGINNIETAMTELRAGTNFFNEDSTDFLIGTNGVGASLVNILSSVFTIKTINSEVYFEKTWQDFIPTKTTERPKKQNEKSGTEISFVPRDYATVQGKKIKLFEGCKWNREYIHTLMIFRNFLKQNDDTLKRTKFNVYFDKEKLNLDIPFLPENAITIKSKSGIFVFWKKYTDSTSISFINGTQCTGIHQKIFNDWINDMFDYNLAHHFYETLVLLNLPVKFVRFADQNKTKYAGGRWEIEDLLKKEFHRKIKNNIGGSELFKDIKKQIDEKLFNENIRIIERKKREPKRTATDKYFPPSKDKDCLFIVEGNSSKGSIMQKRNAKSDGVYTLKGKIKNARKISDLSSNDEIIDLMTILNLKPNEKTKCTYNKVVIATDADADGGHISSLLINLFFKWFPHIIEENRLHILITPLVSVEIKGKKRYFYSMDDYVKFQRNNTQFKNERYLKGLGSLSIDDWEVVMNERRMFVVKSDKTSGKLLEIAFGTSSNTRKKWLQGQI